MGGCRVDPGLGCLADIFRLEAAPFLRTAAGTIHVFSTVHRRFALALEAVWLTRRRRADFHQGQERTIKLLKQAGYMAATGFTIHPTIAFRSGRGPYMKVGIVHFPQFLC